MTQSTKAKIVSIATKARKWAEDYAKRNHFKPNLACMCAIASAHLFEALTKEGLKAKIAYNSSHCFVLTNGYLVDITATQFNKVQYKSPISLEKVIVVKYNSIKPLPDYIFPTWWKVEHKFDSAWELYCQQQETNWPDYQCVQMDAIA